MEHPTHLEALIDFLTGLDSKVVVVDVFYKAWNSARLERPLPAIVAIATQGQVFLVMVARMVSNSKLFRSNFVAFFSKLFADASILKIICSTRGTDKPVVLSTLVSEDPFSPETFSGKTLTPCIDLVDLNPAQSFPILVSNLLGGLKFCDYEENSNWSRPGFLRDSQLHYVAARTWLSLQLFHTLEKRDLAGICEKLFSMNFSNIGATNFWAAWDADHKEQAASRWIQYNARALQQCCTLVESTQEALRVELKEDLKGERSNGFGDDDFTLD